MKVVILGGGAAGVAVGQFLCAKSLERTQGLKVVYWLKEPPNLATLVQGKARGSPDEQAQRDNVAKKFMTDIVNLAPYKDLIEATFDARQIAAKLQSRQSPVICLFVCIPGTEIDPYRPGGEKIARVYRTLESTGTPIIAFQPGPGVLDSFYRCAQSSDMVARAYPYFTSYQDPRNRKRYVVSYWFPNDAFGIDFRAEAHIQWTSRLKQNLGAIGMSFPSNPLFSSWGLDNWMWGDIMLVYYVGVECNRFQTLERGRDAVVNTISKAMKSVISIHSNMAIAMTWFSQNEIAISAQRNLLDRTHSRDQNDQPFRHYVKYHMARKLREQNRSVLNDYIQLGRRNNQNMDELLELLNQTYNQTTDDPTA